MNDIATKAYSKFLKTRQSASKASVRNSHVVETGKIHPLFQEQNSMIEEQ